MSRPWLAWPLLPLLLVGCGSQGGGQGADHGAGGSASSAVSPESPSATAGSPTATPEEGRLGRRVATTPGKVTVVPDAHRVAARTVISAVVANGTRHVVYVENLRTGCSPATLQRSSETSPEGWVAYPDCGSERLPLVLAIGPGRGRTVSIDPASVEATGDKVVAGTYRLVVRWGDSGHSGDLPHAARSTTFEVD